MALEPLGIGPEEMVGVTTVGGAGHVRWAEVAEVELQGPGSEGGEPTRHLLVRLKDGGGGGSTCRRCRRTSSGSYGRCSRRSRGGMGLRRGVDGSVLSETC